MVNLYLIDACLATYNMSLYADCFQTIVTKLKKESLKDSNDSNMSSVITACVSLNVTYVTANSLTVLIIPTRSTAMVKDLTRSDVESTIGSSEPLEYLMFNLLHHKDCMNQYIFIFIFLLPIYESSFLLALLYIFIN